MVASAANMMTPSRTRLACTCAQTKKRRVFDKLMDPIEPLGTGGSLPPRPHAFALQPVQLSTVGDSPGDQGMFLGGGVIVSNKCFNWPEGDARRVGTDRNPAFEETLCWVLVTHSYSGMTYASVGPPSTKASGDGTVRIIDVPGRNAFEHLFGWRAFMEHNLGAGRRAGVSAFGFTDIKQTGKDTTRCIVPWSIEFVAARLASMRGDFGDSLAAYLRDLPMKAALNHEANLEHRPVGGMDLRRMLLIEMLLKGTPLEPLLGPADQARALGLPAPKVPGGAPGLYRRMKEFCDGRYT